MPFNFIVSELTEIQLGYYPKQFFLNEKVVTAKQAYRLLWQIFDVNSICLREEIIVLYFNRSNKMIGYFRAGTGGIAGAYTDIKLIIGTALKCAASGIIIAHNHPSGSLMPSEADKRIARKLKKCCALLEINLIDFLILAAMDNGNSLEPEGYSFVQNGEL